MREGVRDKRPKVFCVGVLVILRLTQGGARKHSLDLPVGLRNVSKRTRVTRDAVREEFRGAVAEVVRVAENGYDGGIREPPGSRVVE